MVLKNFLVYIVVKICNLVKYIGTWKTPVFLSIHINNTLSFSISQNTSDTSGCQMCQGFPPPSNF